MGLVWHRLGGSQINCWYIAGEAPGSGQWVGEGPLAVCCPSCKLSVITSIPVACPMPQASGHGLQDSAACWWAVPVYLSRYHPAFPAAVTTSEKSFSSCHSLLSGCKQTRITRETLGRVTRETPILCLFLEEWGEWCDVLSSFTWIYSRGSEFFPGLLSPGDQVRLLDLLILASVWRNYSMSTVRGSWFTVWVVQNM